MRSEELDLKLLRHLETGENNSQRDLAVSLGMSVGKINYCLRALIDKGWVKANNFRRSDNKWAYAYLLTPSGVSAKIRLARTFLEHKEYEFVLLQEEISALRQEIGIDKPKSQQKN
jgi:EPS-associated MarR family transcriptional regulator